ncbi:hypothetical protein P6B95_39030 [Streptomyces atratus]|uniref:hypothetical protein n=1 Tax=Streptomyces atratus TaxID=1893 RepID=UPI0016700669|nr:hypothetical protein [Streptomyces atratus]WPW32779.1 hypothetical protein P6B95_39030 [Streptomyces atratus]
MQLPPCGRDDIRPSGMHGGGWLIGVTEPQQPHTYVRIAGAPTALGYRVPA